MTEEQIQEMIKQNEEYSKLIEKYKEDETIYKTQISAYESEKEKLSNDLKSTKDLNNQLALKISSQVLNPVKKEETKQDEKLCTFEDILKDF